MLPKHWKIEDLILRLSCKSSEAILKHPSGYFERFVSGHAVKYLTAEQCRVCVNVSGYRYEDKTLAI